MSARHAALRAAEAKPLRPEDVEALQPNRRALLPSDLHEIAALLRVYFCSGISEEDARRLRARGLVFRMGAHWQLRKKGIQALRAFALEYGGSR